MSMPILRLYREFAPWFHLLTAPEDYASESAYYLELMREALGATPGTLLELGAGGGNNASHYKRAVPSVTLTDLSPDMLALSRQLNPECEHLVGDMCTLRLNRQFDAVLVHDAVMYLTTADQLRQAMTTAFVHLRPGGVALFVPDCTRESFVSRSDHGGHDGDGRGLRYLEWMYDPDPTDSTFTVEYALMFREEGQPVRVEHEHHVEGLFGRDDWFAWLRATGFQVENRPLLLDGEPYPEAEVFIAVRPAASAPP